MRLITSKESARLFARIIDNGWESLSCNEKSAYNIRAEYENALDCLYYGCGGKQWRERAYANLGEEAAREVWKMAFRKMSRL